MLLYFVLFLYYLFNAFAPARSSPNMAFYWFLYLSTNFASRLPVPLGQNKVCSVQRKCAEYLSVYGHGLSVYFVQLSSPLPLTSRINVSDFFVLLKMHWVFIHHFSTGCAWRQFCVYAGRTTHPQRRTGRRRCRTWYAKRRERSPAAAREMRWCCATTAQKRFFCGWFPFVFNFKTSKGTALPFGRC